MTKQWVDKEQNATEEGMREGVRCSLNFMLYMTKDVLTRPFCIQEIKMAIEYQKNIIIVYQTDPRYGGVTGSFTGHYDKELRRVFGDGKDYKWLKTNSYVQFHDRGEHVDVMLRDRFALNM